MTKKEELIKVLTILLDDKKSKNETFKVRAYNNVIGVLRRYDGEINEVKDLDDIPNLTKKGSIYNKILEYLDTGKIKEIEQIDNYSTIYKELSKIYGIGPTKAKELINKKGIKSITDLKKKLEEDDDLLNKKQKIGLKYYKELEKRIPSEEIEEHKKYIKRCINEIDKDGQLKYEVTGSNRRGESSSGDIDILFTAKNNDKKLFNKIIKKLLKEGYIKETLAKGDKKFMGISKLDNKDVHRRIDMIYSENYPFALLYFTGSGDFNVEMRNHALSLGYSLNEYGLKKDGEFVKNNNKEFETEEDIFKFLKLKYIEPKKRKAGMIEKIKIK
jgi:DNA polymerase beta